MSGLRSIPAVRVDVTDEQLRAVGHVALQWALLEAEIDRVIVWLSVGAEDPQNLGAKFEDRAPGCQRLATDRMSDRPPFLVDRGQCTRPRRPIRSRFGGSTRDKSR